MVDPSLHGGSLFGDEIFPRLRFTLVNLHSNGKPPFLIGDRSSNGGFPIAVLVYRSVSFRIQKGFLTILFIEPNTFWGENCMEKLPALLPHLPCNRFPIHHFCFPRGGGLAFPPPDRSRAVASAESGHASHCGEGTQPHQVILIGKT